ncbi:amino acid ABC transporter permease/ATP-binding protein [Celerinatantimonas sp. YJH-8]|uniref:amino acid ABC transporter permease/ATP-binding protein n=1 Tax=Celerinatantimonas sp. YJH-8 TaxID=3228714 RepID=UPI0038C10ACC
MSFDVAYFLSLLHDAQLWASCWLVLKLSIATWGLGIILGLFVALGKQSTNPLIRTVVNGYIWFFRSIPLLVLVIFVYNLPQMIPSTSVFLSNPFFAGLLAMVLTEGAFIAEIHRGGLLSVPKGQHEAAKMLGFSVFQKYSRIIVPQALRIELPALTNELITIVKLTSLISVISLPDILFVGQRMYSQNFLVMETLAATGVYYVGMVTVLSWFLSQLEKRLDLGAKKVGSMSQAQCEQIRQSWSQVVPTQHVATLHKSGEPQALNLRQVDKSYGNHQVLKSIQLQVPQGEVIAVIGPSGSGKTSLIRCISHLESLSGGEIQLFGESYIDASGGVASATTRQGLKRIGMVFQQFNLFPHRTILDNVMIGPALAKLERDKSVLQMRAYQLLDRVGLLEHAHKYPHQLSGGQQQRVAIARTLAMDPDILLFDEPTSALDPELVGEVLGVIQQLAKSGMTLMIVTHEMQFAQSISDRILFMENGQIEYDLKADELTAHPDARLRDFMGLEAVA